MGPPPVVRLPRAIESSHLLIMGDSGTGKSALIRQLLQIDARGDTAIVYDPAREYTPQFYTPERGDLILIRSTRGARSGVRRMKCTRTARCPAGFRRRDDVVARHRVLGCRQADLPHFTAELLQRVDSFVNQIPLTRWRALRSIRAAGRSSGPRPCRPVAPCSWARGRKRMWRRTRRVRPWFRATALCRVPFFQMDRCDRASWRTLPVHSGIRGHRSASRRPRHKTKPVGERNLQCPIPVQPRLFPCATAAADPTARSAGDAIERYWIAHRPECRVFIRRAHRELVAVGLSQDHGAGAVPAAARPWRRRAGRISPEGASRKLSEDTPR